jgi:hypothetical protein
MVAGVLWVQAILIQEVLMTDTQVRKALESAANSLRAAVNEAIVALEALNEAIEEAGNG